MEHELAARRAGIPRIVHTYHGFPFHEFQSAARRGAYVAIERRLGQITDMVLCTGTAVAAEAIRRGIAAKEEAELEGREPGRVSATLARVPEMIGFHIGR